MSGLNQNTMIMERSKVKSKIEQEVWHMFTKLTKTEVTDTDIIAILFYDNMIMFFIKRRVTTTSTER